MFEDSAGARWGGQGIMAVEYLTGGAVAGCRAATRGGRVFDKRGIRGEATQTVTAKGANLMN